MHFLENLMYQASSLFLPPVLIAIVLLFLYSIYLLGDFFTQFYLRRSHKHSFIDNSHYWQQNKKTQPVKGYDLFNHAIYQDEVDEDTLTVFALKNLEGVRVVTRIAPMLGLVATMIPMGPALKSLANGNIQGISENLIVAFSAVIFGLIVSSITFWVAAVRKRWLANEMIVLLKKTVTS